MNNTILYISVGLAIYYTIFLFIIYYGLTRLKKKVKKKTSYFTSIIIPFRNEEQNILRNLKSISALEHRKDEYEVIYVDDFSEDNSVQLLKENITSDNIKVLSLPDEYRFASGKKRAIEYGISKSLGDIILTTDADCEYHPKWLSNMMDTFEQHTGFVIGLVEYKTGKSIFDSLQQIEFAGLVISGAGLAGAGYPIISNGANAAYKKNLFYLVNGFHDQQNIASGDELFIMQKIKKHTFKKVEVCIEEDSIVKTSANENIRQFNQQRKRWAGKSIYFYNKRLVIGLAGVFFYYLNYIILIILSLVNKNYLYVLFSTWLLKVLTEYVILKKGKQKLHLNFKLNFIFLIAELLHVPYIIYSTLNGLVTSFIWKDRHLKS